MVRRAGSQRPDRHSSSENIRAGYQAAINLWIYEGTTFWSKFTAMILANTIVVTAITLAITTGDAKNHNLPLFKLGLCVFGVALCLSWIPILKRSFDYYKYWILSARELEQHFLADGVQTVSRGASFADGEKVSFSIERHSLPHQMTCLAGSVSIQTICYLMVAGFVVFYVFILCWI